MGPTVPSRADVVGATRWSELLPGHWPGDDPGLGRPRLDAELGLAPGLSLAVVSDARGRSYVVPLLSTEGGRAVRRARPGEGAAAALVASLAAGTRCEGAFALTCWHHEAVADLESTFGVDQTNDSVVVGDRAVVKWVVRTEAGPHPAPARLQALQRAGFAGIPRPWGVVEHQPADGSAPRLLASVDTLLVGAQDGWTWAVDDLSAAARDGDPAAVVGAGRRLGELAASMHAALAADGTVAATPQDLARWRCEAEAELTDALGVVTGSALAALGPRVPALRVAVQVGAGVVGLPLLAGHGDLHVGQVLRAGSGPTATYVVTDFDGNPVVPPERRHVLEPAAVDLAGLVQSVQHAGLVALRHDPGLDPAGVSSATEQCVGALVASYSATLDRLGWSRLHEPELLPGLRLRQVCRELTYAGRHLPRWSYVPEAALAALLPDGSPA